MNHVIHIMQSTAGLIRNKLFLITALSQELNEICKNLKMLFDLDELTVTYV